MCRLHVPFLPVNTGGQIRDDGTFASRCQRNRQAHAFIGKSQIVAPVDNLATHRDLLTGQAGANGASRTSRRCRATPDPPSVSTPRSLPVLRSPVQFPQYRLPTRFGSRIDGLSTTPTVRAGTAGAPPRPPARPGAATPQNTPLHSLHRRGNQH